MDFPYSFFCCWIKINNRGAYNFCFFCTFYHHFQIAKRNFDGNWYKQTIANSNDELSLPVEGSNNHFFGQDFLPVSFWILCSLSTKWWRICFQTSRPFTSLRRRSSSNFLYTLSAIIRNFNFYWHAWNKTVY